jgi:PEP-CTERM motif-containing protein
MRSSWLGSVVMGCLVLGAKIAQGQVYDAVSNFTGTNPSGTWSYLWGTSVGANLVPLEVPFSPAPQDSGVDNGLAIPNMVRVTRNFGSGNASFATIIVPPNLLDIDPEGEVADVRWTAPTTADYSVSGLFQMTDTDSQPHEVQILRDYNASVPLLADILASPTYGLQVPFDYSGTLSAGESLDFIVNSTAGYASLSTGLSATITVVPEPATIGLFGITAAALLLRRRSRYPF